MALNDVMAGFWAIDMLSSVNSVVKGRFQDRYGLKEVSFASIHEVVFSGLEIDPENANLPDIK